MKHFTLKRALCVLLFGVIAGVGMAQLPSIDTGRILQRDVGIYGTISATTITGVTITPTTLNATTLNVATAFTNNGIEIMPPTAVSLTSPTVTTTAAGARLLVITTDETQTGFIINGGTLNQVLTIRGTNDSSTVRFDDGTSYTLAGNAELGLNDYIVLQCTAAGNPASTWAEISRSLN